MKILSFFKRISAFALITVLCALPSLASTTIIESDNTALVTKHEPDGTKWTDSSVESGYQYPMNFVKDKPFMASGGTALSSGWGWLMGPGTGAELRYTFRNQKSVSVGFLIHAQGQVAEIYVDDVLKTTIDTQAWSSIDYGGCAGTMREVCVANDLSMDEHTVRVRNTGTYNYSPTTAWDSTTKMYGGRGTQLIVDFFRTGNYSFGTIKGTITDGSGVPIQHARVKLNSFTGPFIDDGKTINYSDGNGYFEITALPADTYTLTAERGNKLNYSTQITVTGGDTVTHNISYTSTVHITRPRLMAPTVVARGDTLVVEVAAPSDTSNWGVSLANDYKTIGLNISTSYGATNIWNNTRPGWQLTATIPADTPQELWNLVVTNSGGTGTEYKSVKVMNNYDKSFYLTHLTDTHCDTRFKKYNDLTFSMMLEQIDIINPNFLALSGDFCQSPGITQAYDKILIPILRNTGNVPVFISRGNHESPIALSLAQDNKFWESIIGQLTYSVKMGQVRLFVHDVMDENSKTWLQSAYAASQADETDKVRIYVTHTLGSFKGAWYPKILPYPTVTLFGHRHSDDYQKNSGYPQIRTGTAQEGVYRMRLVRFNRDDSGNWTLGSVGYQGNNLNSMVMATSPTAPKIRRVFQHANDGSSNSNSVSITNDLDETFENGRARFIMAKGAVNVSGSGTLVESYDSDDNTKTIVLVKINIAPNATTSCSVNTDPGR